MLLWSAGQAAYNKILISKVRSDLVLAQQKFQDLQSDQLSAMRAWAESAYLRGVLQRNRGVLPAEELEAKARELGLSYLRLVGPGGVVLVSHPAAPAYRVDWSGGRMPDPQTASVNMIMMSASELEQISPELRGQAIQKIYPTSNAMPSSRSVEDRGLVMQKLQPIFHDGQWIGTLEAGTLLNGNLDIVDQINGLIYSPNTLLDGSVGTTTIFLEDIRVATTVKATPDTRALGTRVSESVRRTVLGRGEVWLERAFVVNDWYVAAYAPLIDPSGARIGMFYVGFLETPYANIRTQLLVLFLIAVGGAMFLGAIMVARLASGIFYPLRRMNFIMSEQESGDTAARVGSLGRADEFADLAEHFDALLDQLEARRVELEELNSVLDERVRQRTKDLQAANKKLQQAIEQLLASEKLAVMGQLTAGLAHEFNNPLAVMMGHLDLVRINTNDPNVTSALKLLDEQIHRMRNIVQKLLQFSRPSEFASYTEQVDVNSVVQDSLLFAKGELGNVQATTHCELHASRTVQISRTELQQVMVNLLINAAHAVENNLESLGVPPEICISSEDVQTADDQDAVRIRVCNNGPAIALADQQLVFKMFYTTKAAGRGTGLGLPVSRMLLQRYGGDLNLTSPWPDAQDARHGVCFDILIRCAARPSADILKETDQQLLLLEKQIFEGS